MKTTYSNGHFAPEVIIDTGNAGSHGKQIACAIMCNLLFYENFNEIIMSSSFTRIIYYFFTILHVLYYYL